MFCIQIYEKKPNFICGNETLQKWHSTALHPFARAHTWQEVCIGSNYHKPPLILKGVVTFAMCMQNFIFNNVQFSLNKTVIKHLLIYKHSHFPSNLKVNHSLQHYEDLFIITIGTIICLM